MKINAEALLIDALTSYVSGRAFSDKSFRLREARIPKPPTTMGTGIKRMIQAGFKNAIPGKEILQQTIISTVAKELESLQNWALNNIEDKNNVAALEQYASDFHNAIDPNLQPRRTAIQIYEACGKLGLSDMEAIYVCLTIAHQIWPNETKALKPAGEVAREIHFAPEHQQASIGILSYFSVILRERLPDTHATVTIRQEKDRVVLVINYIDGTREEISQLLEDYGLVVVGKKPASDLLTNDYQIVALQQKLEMAALELRLSKDMHAMELRRVDQTIYSKDLTIEYLKNELSQQLRDNSKLTTTMIAELTKFSHMKIEGNTRQLIEELMGAILDKNEERLQSSAHAIAASDPSVFSRIGEFMLSSAMSGILGNSAYNWLLLNWPVIAGAASALKI